MTEPKGAAENGTNSDVPVCGVVRPIAGMEGYPEGHWLEVHQIIAEAADAAGFQAKLVSDDEAIGVILGRIVSNLHDHPIVVVDVSGLNPNVFFELGMRLTFDKPTVVIKDDATRYPFDASPIEYIPYPSNLRHSPLMSFKSRLTSAIQATAEAGLDPNNKSFLKHFGSVKAGQLGESQTISTALILEEIRSLKGVVRRQDNWTASPAPRLKELRNTGLIRTRCKIDREGLANVVGDLQLAYGANCVSVEHSQNGLAKFEIMFSPSSTTADHVAATVNDAVKMYGGTV